MAKTPDASAAEKKRLADEKKKLKEEQKKQKKEAKKRAKEDIIIEKLNNIQIQNSTHRKTRPFSGLT